MFVYRGADILALAEALFINAAGQVKIADLESTIGRIAAETEWAVGGSQVSRARKRVRHAGNADVGRKIVSSAKLMRHDAAKARELNRRTRAIAREHVV